MSTGTTKQYVFKYNKKEIINVAVFLIRTVKYITGASAEQKLAGFVPMVVPYPCNGLLT